MDYTTTTELKTICEGLGRVLIFLQDGHAGTEGKHDAMLLIQSFAYDLRSVAEKLRQGAAGER